MQSIFTKSYTILFSWRKSKGLNGAQWVCVCVPVYSCVHKNNIGWCMCMHALFFFFFTCVYKDTATEMFQQHFTHYILIYQMATWKDSLRTLDICCVWEEYIKSIFLKNQHFLGYLIMHTTTHMDSHTLDSAVMVSIAELLQQMAMLISLSLSILAPASCSSHSNFIRITL